MSRENIGNETACSKKREIRPLTQQDIEAYLDIYLNSYPAYESLDAECRQHYREKHQLELREDREVQTVGLFEDGILIATIKLVSFSMNFFGKMQLFRAYDGKSFRCTVQDQDAFLQQVYDIISAEP